MVKAFERDGEFKWAWKADEENELTIPIGEEINWGDYLKFEGTVTTSENLKNSSFLEIFIGELPIPRKLF